MTPSKRLLWMISPVAVVALGAWLNAQQKQTGSNEQSGGPSSSDSAVVAQVDSTPSQARTLLAQSPSTQPEIRVSVLSPEAGGLPLRTTLPCSAHWFESAELLAKASGYIKTQAVDIGSRVKKGDVVAVLDTPELERELDLVRASLVQAQAEVVQMEARRKTSRADLKAAQASVAKAQAEVSRWVAERTFREKELARFQELSRSQSVQTAIVDEKMFQKQSAEAAIEAAQSSIETARQLAEAAAARVELADADVEYSKAKAGVAEARVKSAEELASYARILSPYDGIVTSRNFHPGEFVKAAAAGGTSPLFRIARTDLIRVVTFIPDREVRFANPGDTVTIEFDALPGQEFKGTLSRIAHAEDAQSRTMRAEVDLPNAEMAILDQFYGRITIDLEPAAKGVRVPSSCLVGNVAQGKGQLFVVRDGVARLVPVGIASDNGRVVEIFSGLETTDKVIARAPAGLADGTPVVVVTSPSASG